jgi:hypothetical protein
MLLQNIKDVVNGRVIVKDNIIRDNETYNVFAKRDGKKTQFNNKPLTSIEADQLVKEIENGKIPSVEKGSAYRMSIDSKDSSYTQAEYQAKMTILSNQLQQAKQLGDSEEAIEIQKEIDDMKASENGVQDKATKDKTFSISTGRWEGDVEIIDGTHIKLKPKDSDKWASALHFNQVPDDIMNALKSKGQVQGNFFKDAENIFTEEARNQISENMFHKKYNELSSPQSNAVNEAIQSNAKKSKDSEEKITDLTEKAKAARAMGYDTAHYDAEIEKLKALDDDFKWAKIGQLKEAIARCKRDGNTAEATKLEKQLEDQLSKDTLTEDPTKDGSISRTGNYKGIKWTVKHDDKGYDSFIAESDLDDETFKGKNENSIIEELKNWIDGHAK